MFSAARRLLAYTSQTETNIGPFGCSYVNVWKKRCCPFVRRRMGSSHSDTNYLWPPPQPHTADNLCLPLPLLTPTQHKERRRSKTVKRGIRYLFSLCFLPLFSTLPLSWMLASVSLYFISFSVLFLLSSTDAGELFSLLFILPPPATDYLPFQIASRSPRTPYSPALPSSVSRLFIFSSPSFRIASLRFI